MCYEAVSVVSYSAFVGPTLFHICVSLVMLLEVRSVSVRLGEAGDVVPWGFKRLTFDLVSASATVGGT